MIPTNMTAIKENNRKLQAQEDKEDSDLETIGDISKDSSSAGSTSSESGDLFDREMADSAKDDHKPLQESLMETYHETSKVEEQTKKLKKQLTDKGEAEKLSNQTSNSTGQALAANATTSNSTKVALP